MLNLSVRNIVKAVGGEYHGPIELIDKEITGVSKDSREIEEGYLYIPFVGERADGHAYIPQVFEKGALITFSERELQLDVPYIKVNSSGEALKSLAAFYRKGLKTQIIGIVGSVGKTSTKEMVASVLEQKFKVLKTAGNLNNEIGMPLTLLNIREEHEIAVVEMGISDFDEMTRLAQVARPDMVIMTNIGECHLENLKDKAGVLKAKSEVIPYIKDYGVLVLNDDDEYLTTIKDDRRIEVYRYGIKSDKSLKAKASEVTPDGSNGISFKLMLGKEERDVTIPIPGEHNVYNALAAAVIGAVNKLNIDEIKEGIESIKTLSGRNNKIEANGITIFDDCYNANPMSMKAALSVLKDAKARKIAVLGDMGELGDNTEELHYSVGEYAGSCGIDMIVLSGTLSRKIAEGALTANPMQMVCHFDSVDEMTEFLKEEKKPGDTILVKASHFMKYENVVEALKKEKV